MTGLVNAVGFIFLLVAGIGLFVFFRMLSAFRAGTGVDGSAAPQSTIPDPDGTAAPTGS